MPSYLTRRAGVWHFARRVPLEFADLDPRGLVKQSTKVRVADDRAGVRAGRVAEQMSRDLEAYWRDLLDGRRVEAQRRYIDARRRARAYGFDYKPATEVADLPVDEILQRVQALYPPKVAADPDAARAVLGGEAPDETPLSALFEVFAQLTQSERIGMSPDQLRKWERPKRRALGNLLNVVADKPLCRLSRGDALAFRDWLQALVVKGMQVDTANKEIGHISRMLRVLDRRNQTDLARVFGDLRLLGGEKSSRLPFASEHIRDTLLRPGAMDTLNEQARRIVYTMVNTGLRPSEIANLTDATIHLDAEVPYVRVRADGRRLKTRDSERDVPLVGVSLAAMRLQPQGFPRYRDKGASLSRLIGNYFANNRLLPSRDHTLYSLRHSLKDRLREVDAPEELVDALMGHSNGKPRYGSGHTLAKKAEWLRKIAFEGPPAV